MRLIGDGASKPNAQLGAQLGLDESIRAQRLFGIIIIQIGFAARGRDPNGGQRSGATARLRYRKFLHRRAQALTHDVDGWQRD